VRRREFITLLGGAAAAATSFAARAQQPAGQPLVGLLSPVSATAAAHYVGVFRRGMRDLGYVEGASTDSQAGGSANCPSLRPNWSVSSWT